MTNKRFPKANGLWRARVEPARTLKLAAPILLTLTLATPAQADVSGAMQDFWNGVGVSNSTGPSAFAGQSAGYYTGGNLFMRTPSRNTTLATINLPSHRAGCGGIDLFSGGFSFINSDELVALMKSIGNNAVAYSFKLALETISPMIAEQIGELQDWIQKINQFNMNSCETAKGIVGGLWPRSETASRVICEDLGDSSGIFTDRAASRHGCGSQGRRQSTLNSASGAMRDQIPTNINIAWMAAKKNPLFSGDRDLSELIMTLSGTVVVLAPANDDASPRFQYYGHKAETDQLIAALLQGGTAKINRCFDSDKCLSVNPNANLVVSTTHAFSERVRRVLESIQDKIDTDGSLNADEQALLNSTNIPIYKIINVMTAYQGGLSSLSLPQYSDLIALDILYRFASDLMGEIEKGGAALTLADDQIIKDWREGLQSARRSLREKMAGVSGNFQKSVSIIESARVLEQHLIGNMSAHMRANIGWVNGSE